jgi:hypothetical protein
MRAARIEHQAAGTEFGSLFREVAGARGGRKSSPEAGARPAAHGRRLFTPVEPVHGESLRGLVYRACSVNGLPNAWGLVQYAGVLNRNRMLLAESADVDVRLLAYSIGVHEAEVQARRYPDIGGGHRSFFGLDLHASAIETRKRRFSPAAFKAGSRIHQAVWELRDLPFCLMLGYAVGHLLVSIRWRRPGLDADQHSAPSLRPMR